MNSRSIILKAAKKRYRKSGLQFTMQDLSDDLHMAKKTIYKEFSTKEELLIAMLDDSFLAIQKTKQKILQGNGPYAEQIGNALIAMPKSYAFLRQAHIHGLFAYYPRVAKHLVRHLEKDWEPIFDSMQKGMKEGSIRPVHLEVFKQIVTGSIEQFMKQPETNISYMEKLTAMRDILMKGIINYAEDHAE